MKTRILQKSQLIDLNRALISMRLIVLLSIIFLANNLSAQTPEDLKKNLTIAASDSAKVSLLGKLCVSYANSNPDSLRKYTEQLEGFLSYPEFEFVKRKVLRYRGAIHAHGGMYDSAIYYFEQERQLAEEEGDSLFVIMSYVNIGGMYSHLGQAQSSIEILLKALKEIDKTHSDYFELYYHVYSNISNAHQSLRKYDQCLSYARKAYVAAKRLKSKKPVAAKTLEAMATENIGSAFISLTKYDSALLYLYDALSLTQKLNMPHKTAMIHSKIGEVLTLNGDNKQALDHLQKSLEYFDESSFSAEKGKVYHEVGDLYVNKHEYPEALKAHLIALENFQETGTLRQKVIVLNTIANDYKQLGRMNKAFDFLSQHKALQDSLFSQQTAEATEEMQAKYETEKKEKELALQTAQISEQELKFNKQQLIRNIAIGGAIFLGFVAFLIFWIKTRSNKEISDKNAQLGKSLSERESLLKEIHHRVKNNLQIIASLLYLQSDDTENKSVKKLLEEGQGRVRSMALIHQKLYENDDLKSIPFEEYLEELIGEIKKSFGQPVENVQLEVDAKDIFFDVDTAVPLGLIINELSTNAFKYAYSKKLDGTFKVILTKDGDTYKMQVADDGIGIPDDQLNSTTSKSLGLKLTKMLSDQLEGEYDFSNLNGTTFNLKFAV